MSQPVKDLAQLKQILKSAVQGDPGSEYIILDQSLFDAAGTLVGYLQLPDAQLKVVQKPGEPLIINGDNDVTVQGTGVVFEVTGNGNTQSVNCSISIVGTVPLEYDVVLNMTAKPIDAGWKFTDCFLPLPQFKGVTEKQTLITWQDSFFNNFPLTSPAFLVNTALTNGVPAGINLDASLDTTTGTLATFLKDYLPASLSLKGAIMLRADKFPLLNLHADLPTFIFEQVTTIKLRLLTGDKNEQQGIDKDFSTALIEGHVTVGSFPPFTISGPVLQGSTIWALTIQLDNPKNYTLANGINALLGFGGNQLVLPPGIDAFASMYLDSLTVGLKPRKNNLPAIYTLGASVKCTKDWTLPMTGVSIRDMYMYWEVNEPLGNDPQVVGSISGVIALGSNNAQVPEADIIAMGISVDITGLSKNGNPSVTIKGELLTEKGKTASIDQIVEHFLGLNPSLGLEIAQLSFEAHTAERTFLFYTSLTGTLPFHIPGVEFKQASFGVQYSPNKMTGQVGVGLILAGLPLVGYADYRGKNEGWMLKGGITTSLAPIPNLGVFLTNINSDWFGGLPESIKIIQLTGLMTTFDTKSKAFTLDIGVEWKPTIAGKELAVAGEFYLQSEAVSPTENAYSGYVKGSISFVDLRTAITYAFAKNNTSYTFEIDYKSFQLIAVLMQMANQQKPSEKDWVLKVNFGSTSFGDILSFLVSLVDPNIDFKLSAPWDALNEINLKNLSLVINLTQNTVGINYSVEKDFGFFYLKELGLQYKKQPGKNSVYFIITGRLLEKTYDDANPLTWDALNEAPPAVPGKGTRLLDLRYLGMGQNITFRDTKDFKTVADVIDALKADFTPVDTSIDTNPLKQLPNLKFAGGGRWLLGTDFTLVDAISLAAVFNDPELYGIHIGLSGEKVKQLSGLSFDILYKKVTDTIGVYQIELKLPDAMRQFEFGSVSVTVPIINLDIYTNGNFRIDMGFPRGTDFSRSFCVQFFPFIGYGGFYFALLNGQTSRQVPRIINGDFSPVIEFGVALSIGLGKTIDKGILKAGVSVVVVGIIEGVFGWFHANDKSLPDATFYKVKGSASLVGKLYGEVNFVIISAKVEVVAYATFSFTIEAFKAALIGMQLGVSVTASVKIVFFTVHFSFSTTLDLSFTVGSDSNTPWIVDKNSPQPNPFMLRMQGTHYRYQAVSASAILRLQRRNAYLADFAWTPVNVFDGAIKPITLSMLPSFTVALPATVNRLQNLALTATDPQVQTVMSLFIPNSINASARTHEEVKSMLLQNAGDQPFNQLVTGMIRWALHSMQLNPINDITIAELEDLLNSINKEEDNDTIFSYEQLTSFISLNYLLEITSLGSSTTTTSPNEPFTADGPVSLSDTRLTATSTPSFAVGATGATGPQERSAAFFPMIPELIMAPDDQPSINFREHSPVDEAYEKLLRAYLRELLVQYEENNARNPEQHPVQPGSAIQDITTESMATFIFKDYFTMLVKQGVSSCIDMFNRYPYTVQSGDSLYNIANQFPKVSFEHAVRPHDTLSTISTYYGVPVQTLSRLNNHLNAVSHHQKLAAHTATIMVETGVTPASVAKANADVLLNDRKTNPVKINVPGLNYQVMSENSLGSIALQFGIGNAGALISPNDPDTRRNTTNKDLLLINGTVSIPNSTYTVAADQTLDEVTAWWVVRGRINEVTPSQEYAAWYAQNIVDCNSTVDFANLQPGTAINIPEIILDANGKPVRVDPNNCAWKVYVSRLGDTLDFIAGYYTLSQLQNSVLSSFRQQIIMLNPGIPPVNPGQTLKIPVFNHTILPNDTFEYYTILFGVTTDQLAQANLASRTLLKPLAVLKLPVVTHYINTGDTLASLANLFNLSVEDLAWKIEGVVDIFKQSQQLIIPDVPKRNGNQMLNDLVNTGAVNNISAMVTRFILHGLRVPDPSDKAFTSMTLAQMQALTGDEVKTWALYEIAGQQFPAPTGPVGATALYHIDFTKSPTAHWISFPGSTDPAKLVVSLTKQDIRDNSPSTLFNPDLITGPTGLALAQQTPKHYNLEKSIHWQSATPLFSGATGPVGGTGQIQKGPGEPSIWVFPDTLLNALATTTGATGATAAARKYEIIEARSKGSNGTSTRKLSYYTWATAIELDIQRIPITGADGVLTNTYLVLGTPESGRTALQDCWTYLQKTHEQATIYLLYPPGYVSGNAGGLASNALNKDATFLLKTNLSSVTHNGPQGLTVQQANKPIAGDYYARINAGEQFLQYLWEASITGTGGFYLNYTDTSGAGLPDELFANSNDARIWMMVLLPSQQGNSNAKTLLPFNNCAVIADNLDTGAIDIYAQVANPGAGDFVSTANVPPGNIAFQVTRKNPDYTGVTGPALLTKNLYNLLAYQVDKNDYFKASKQGLPVGPIEYDKTNNVALTLPAFANTDESLWDYHCVIPVAKFGLVNNIPGGTGLPDRTLNPYQGITFNTPTGVTGLSQARILSQFQDIYGNRTTSTNPLQPLTLPVGYTDQLIGIAAWPGAAATYEFAEGNQPQLQLNIGLQTSKYLPAAGYPFDKSAYSAATDVQRYKEIFYQLFQDDVKLDMQTSLDQTGQQLNAYALDRLPFRNYVAGSYIFLNTVQYLQRYKYQPATSQALNALAGLFGVTLLELGTENQYEPAEKLFASTIAIPSLYTVVQMDTLVDIAAASAQPLTPDDIAKNNITAPLYAGNTLRTNARQHIAVGTLPTKENTLRVLTNKVQSNIIYDFTDSSTNKPVGIGFMQVNWSTSGLIASGLNITIQDITLNTSNFPTFEALYYGFTAKPSLSSLTKTDFANAIRDIEGFFDSNGYFDLQDHIVATGASFESILALIPSPGKLKELVAFNEKITTIFVPGTPLFLYATSYQPKAGDTIATIAAQHSLTADQLVAVNGNSLTSDNYPWYIPNLVNLPTDGEPLYAPYNPKGSDTLIAISLPVLPAGNQLTLQDIADQFNLVPAAGSATSNAANLAIANRALAGLLQPGTQIISSKSVLNPPTITVGENDTFNSLLNRFKTQFNLNLTIEDLVSANADKPGIFKDNTPFLLPLNNLAISTSIQTHLPATIFAVTVQVNIKRSKYLVHPEFTGNASVYLATSTIAALPGVALDGQDASVSYQAFALQFEKAFAAYKLKLATGKKTTVLDAEKGKTLWAVNFGADGIKTFDIRRQSAAFYALSPLSTSLISQDVSIRQYTSGQGLSSRGETMTFQSVDLDLWMKDFLTTLDLLLTPEYSIPAFSLAGFGTAAAITSTRAVIPEPIAEGPIGIAGFNDTASQAVAPSFAVAAGATGGTGILPGYTAYEDIVAAKDVIAGYFSNNTTNILDQPVPINPAFSNDAKETVKQQMLTSFTSAYNIDALVQLPVKVEAQFQQQPISPRFSGPLKVREYKTGTAVSLNTLSTTIGGNDYQVYPPYLAEIIVAQSQIIQPNVTITYNTRTYTTNSNDTLTTIAVALGVDVNQQSDAYWPGWVAFITAIGDLVLIAATASFNEVTVRRPLVATDTLDTLALYFNLAVQIVARANASLPGIFLPDRMIKWAPGKTYKTTGNESFNDILNAIHHDDPQYSIDSLAVAISHQPNLLKPGKTIFGLQPFPDSTLSTSKVPLGPLSPTVKDSVLTFTVNVKHEARFKKIFLNLDYVINEMEFDIADVQGAADYQSSSWLTFILPIGHGQGTDVGINLSLGQVEIPLPLNAYPTPPSLLNQTGVPTDAEATTIAAAKLWDYSFSYQSLNAAQDTDHIEVNFNNPLNGVNIKAIPRQQLFAALAQFATIQTALRNDLALLPTLNGNTSNLRAQVAVSVFAQIANAVAGITGLRAPMAEAANARQQYQFKVDKSTDASGLQLKNISLLLEKYVGPTGGAPSSNPSQQGGWPSLDIYQPQIGATDNWYKLELKSHDSSQAIYTIPDDANIKAGQPLVQRYAFGNRDIINNQNALGGVYLTRNADLYAGNPQGITGVVGPLGTNPAFIYKTPMVYFVNRLTPFINNQQVFPVGPTGIAAPNPLSGYLMAAFNEILDIGTGLPNPGTFNIKVACSFGYALTGEGTGSPVIATYPILLMPNIPYNAANAKGITDGIAGNLINWINQHPVNENGGYFMIDITVFEQDLNTGATAGNPQLPILRLNNLQIAVGPTGVPHTSIPLNHINNPAEEGPSSPASTN